MKRLLALLLIVASPALADNGAPSLFYEPPSYNYEAPSYRYEPPEIAPPRRPVEQTRPGSQQDAEQCTTRAAGYDPETHSTLDTAGNRVACPEPRQR